MMSVTISRSDLLNAFEKLQSQFNHALSDAQAKDQEFEELRGRFRQNLERRLKDAEKYLPVGNPLAGQVSELLNLISENMENVEKEDKNVYEAYLDEINHETANNLYDIVDNTNIEGLKELKKYLESNLENLKKKALKSA